MDINLLVQGFASAHPIYYGGACLAIGAIGPKVMDYALTEGIDKVIPKILAFQEFYLKKIGVKAEQIKALQKKEAEALIRAGQDVQKDEVEPDAPKAP